MLIANTWPISLHFFKLLSQLPSFDPYKNPLRHEEEVITGHSLQVSSLSQQVHLSTCGPSAEVSALEDRGEQERTGPALATLHSPNRTHINNKIVAVLIHVEKEHEKQSNDRGT